VHAAERNCEFLHKLDLTVNFIDLGELESSVDHLVSRERLKDLYMMGNPCQANWDGFTNYVIAKLPQLQTLDGTEITRSMQIIASQKLPALGVGDSSVLVCYSIVSIYYSMSFDNFFQIVLFHLITLFMLYIYGSNSFVCSPMNVSRRRKRL